jgi:hypothetical protein
MAFKAHESQQLSGKPRGAALKFVELSKSEQRFASMRCKLRYHRIILGIYR